MNSSPQEIKYDAARIVFYLARLRYNRALLELQRSYGEDHGNDSFDDTVYEIKDDQSTVRAMLNTH